MAKIPLTKRKFKGQYVIVDDSDFEILSQWNWCEDKDGYVIRTGRKSDGVYMHRLIRMHRQILNALDSSLEVDHINHNVKDNRKSNLRLCKRKQNMENSRISKHSTSGYKGVYWHRAISKWCAQITIDGRCMHLGLFLVKKQAALAYNEAAKQYFGEFACLNVL